MITQAGDHEKVAGLVYVEAFVPDVGESPFGLIPQDPNHKPPFDFTEDGFAFFSEAVFVPGFADAVPQADAEFFRDSQVPISLEGASTPLSVAAWKDKPSARRSIRSTNSELMTVPMAGPNIAMPT